jgi:hypothetical protein
MINTYTTGRALGGATVELDGPLDIGSTFDASGFSPLKCCQHTLVRDDEGCGTLSYRTSPVSAYAKVLKRATTRSKMTFLMVANMVRFRERVWFAQRE